MDTQFFDRRSRRRKGAAAIFSMVLLVVLLGFASLTLDVGAIYNTRADLQNAADSASLAGAAAYTMAAMDDVRMGKTTDIGPVRQAAIKMAQDAGLLNRSFAAGGTQIPNDDIELGWIDIDSGTSELDTTASPDKYNAVRVSTYRSATSPNGPVKLFFAPIFGKNTSDVSASAVAVFDDRFSGIDVAVPNAPSVWPFTIHEDEYQKWTESSTDNYIFDADQGVQSGKDEVSEVQLYPDKLAPGNYGLLNIGTPNQSSTALSQQIINGVSPDDLETETGSSELVFYDDSGSPQTYPMTGNPGLKASLETSIEKRIGDIVAFFLHDQVTESGSNTTYRITGTRFARVMAVNLNGSTKGLWLQPVTYIGPGIITIPGAPSSDGIAGQILLVR